MLKTLKPDVTIYFLARYMPEIAKKVILLHRFIIQGEVLEWLKRHAWKACKPLKGFVGSNPILSAVQV